MSEERPRDVQALSDADTRVYEAVAMLAVDGGTATADEVIHATALPEESVRRSLETLTEAGWLKAAGAAYVLGPHRWGVERLTPGPGIHRVSTGCPAVVRGRGVRRSRWAVASRPPVFTGCPDMGPDGCPVVSPISDRAGRHSGP
ncbi:hypothetical protein AB0395_01810 [Streptosporangium sp. NPDC051023]|uniref:hypothetical protein n=1 Tax=Streptosporangium sp. NPDC051023 TaxID=3155410 RepID=UPI00344B30E1